MTSDISTRIEDLVTRFGATELTRMMGISFGALKSMRGGRDRIDGSSAYPLIEMIERGADEEELVELDEADAVREMKEVLIEGRLTITAFAGVAGITRLSAHNWLKEPSPRSKRARVAFIRAIGRQLAEAREEENE